ncbi:MAG: dephospho-CoA kinase [Burkholderiaceae bacterium]|nr:dephospho-CoA kinase [Burkholderiaceae bacterium]
MSAQPFSVGLTGGIGSGKTTVANLFAERGASIIDTDAIAHQLTVAGGAAIEPIRAEFGAAVIDAAGALDRAAMRARVFADREAKIRLEAILHPLIRNECERQAAAAQGSYVMFAVPLLVESGRWAERVSRVLVVDCPEDLQVSRVMARSNMTEAQVRAIMATQATRAQRLAAADDVIVNDGPATALVPEIERLHALYSRLASQSVTK